MKMKLLRANLARGLFPKPRRERQEGAPLNFLDVAIYTQPEASYTGKIMVFDAKCSAILTDVELFRVENAAASEELREEESARLEEPMGRVTLAGAFLAVLTIPCDGVER